MLTALVGAATGLMVGTAPRAAVPTIHMNVDAAKAKWLASQEPKGNWGRGTARPRRSMAAAAGGAPTAGITQFDDHSNPVGRLDTSYAAARAPANIVADYGAKFSPNNAPGGYTQFDDHSYPDTRLMTSYVDARVPSSIPAESNAKFSPGNAPGGYVQYDDHGAPVQRLDTSGNSRSHWMGGYHKDGQKHSNQ